MLLYWLTSSKVDIWEPTVAMKESKSSREDSAVSNVT